ncbi:expressed unknown protein [Seminavis robusta]|uniref:Uncharacterized protein n=1 Tax=Seminavis robusta TaxID=568900 RepID=A0A9N8H6X5_9STRA|nr:expressed unknown protein [Seminavis robusta]|eukprot:Sro184_g080000.1 n/a (129) ;mRNA; f:57424-57810
MFTTRRMKNIISPTSNVPKPLRRSRRSNAEVYDSLVMANQHADRIGSISRPSPPPVSCFDFSHMSDKNEEAKLMNRTMLGNIKFSAAFKASPRINLIEAAKTTTPEIPESATLKASAKAAPKLRHVRV